MRHARPSPADPAAPSDGPAPEPAVADFGCGSGAATLVLAAQTPAPEAVKPEPAAAAPAAAPATEAPKPAEAAPEKAKSTLRDLRSVFTEEQLKKETARCLGCGASVVDENRCIGCGVCTTKCEFDAIHLSRELPEASHMYKTEDKMKAILPYMIKRAIKIKTKKKSK